VPDVLRIDGSFGEGGGQIVRSSLALALVTGRAVAIDHIRAGRKKPGLMRQHLAAVAAAAQVCSAEVDGATLGSARLLFRPGRVRPGNYDFRIGSAGSTTLVFQTVLPALLVAEGPSQLTLEGGTHNPLAPPYEFLEHTYLPLVNRMGPRIATRLTGHGFYPAGGGAWNATIEPSRHLARLDLLEREGTPEPRVRVLISRLPRHIAQRECQTIAAESGWPPHCIEVEEITDSPGPGNVVLVFLEAENVTEVCAAFGKIGVRAEEVARQALRSAQDCLAADVPVGEHLADQLLLPLALGAYLGSGGGAFRTMALSPHATTHLEIIRRFLDIQAEVTQDARGAWLVRIG
jgi:RNA 3'-terminal phosphate cyclase (ATP)